MCCVAALTALITVGWHKPARAEPRNPRGVVGVAVPPPGIAVVHEPTLLERHPGPVRRSVAALAVGGLAVLTGMVVAVVTAVVTTVAVVRMTELLQR